MDRSYPYSRRLVSRSRLRKRLAAVAVAGLAGAAAMFVLAWTPDPIAATVAPPARPLLAMNSAANDAGGPAEAVQRGVRRIYPYSVVPGGVADQVELKRIIRTDSVVAAHYARFDADAAHAVVVAKPRAVHVSYRKGDKVYWTAHKVMLEAGETLLSDGSNEMRARCANRISDLPQYPVEAHRPAMEELDQPIELADGEAYALDPDGMPVAMGGDGLARRIGGRFPLRAGGSAGDSGSGGTAREGTLASAMSPGLGAPQAIRTMGLSGSSSSIANRPQPAGLPVSSAPETSTPPDPAAGSGPADPAGGSGSSGSPPAAGGDTAPAPAPGPGTVAPAPAPDTTDPQPPAIPAPDPRPPAPQPAPLPGTDPVPAPAPVPPSTPVNPPPGEQSGGGSSEPPQTPPGPVTGTVPPMPAPHPAPPQGSVDAPAPTEVPEPGSLWLFAIALAVLGLLRRRRPA